MKLDNRCIHCFTTYPTFDEARSCELKHKDDIIYVPLLRDDLNRLVNYIVTNDRALLTERLSRTLYRYFRAK